MTAVPFAALLLFPLSVVALLPDANCEPSNCAPMPSCDGRSDVPSGESFPLRTSAVDACGRLEQRLVRSNTSSSFERLVQYRGEDVVFVNEENTNTWCGDKSRSCVDCRNGQPAATDTRPNSDQCADRLMSGRLYSRLKLLQRLVAKEWPKRRVRVSEAWDESTSTDVVGIHPPSSLHYEGRSARLDVSIEITTPDSVPDRDDDVALLSRLGALTVCAGFDHVHHDVRGFLTVSVKRQKGRHGTVVIYPSGATFLEVAVPESSEYDYEAEADAELLVDSDGRQDERLSTHFTVRDVLSFHNGTGQAYRYFRFDPDLLYCLELVYKKLKDGRLDIVSAYRTRSDEDVRVDSDKENRRHTLGSGVETRLVNSKTSPMSLATTFAEECGLDLAEKGKSFGAILLREGVYFDIRWSLFVSTGAGVNTSKDDFQRSIQYSLVNAERRIDIPQYLSDVVCDYQELVPSVQSHEYEYVPPKQSPITSCPEDGTETDFCARSKANRVSEVNKLWKVIELKHFWRERSDVRRALDGCLVSCSPCIQGTTWNEKVKACNEFAHWVSLGLSDRENEGNTNAHFYALTNEETKVKACRSGSCFHRTECLLSIGPLLLEGSFYPNEQSLKSQKLYGIENNPSPLMEILHQTYAMHAVEKATLWITSIMELASLNGVTKALMLYNKRVTEIEIRYKKGMVSEDDALAFMRNSVAQWTTTSCSQVTKSSLSPYQVTSYS